MKKTIFLAAIISAFSITATYAQDTPPPAKDKKEARGGERRGPGGMGMMDMYKDLNLTKDQEEKIKKINEEQRTKFEELRSNNSLSDEARREKRMEMMKERTEKVNAVLTKDQQEKLAAKMKERGDRGPGARNNDKK
jgi:Spy/CpxP family protein refolding chaperone